MRIVYHVVSAPAPLGLMFAAMTDKGLRYLLFMDRRSLKRTRQSLESANPGAVWEHSVREMAPVAKQLQEYFDGERQTFSIPLDPVGSEFQLDVWRALAGIPFGETRTYGEIASAIGQAKAARAVGLANNQNPLPIVVPCHRVIGADGKLVGYAGGVARKKFLLELERRYAAQRPVDGESVIASLHVKVARPIESPRAKKRRKAPRSSAAAARPVAIAARPSALPAKRPAPPRTAAAAAPAAPKKAAPRVAASTTAKPRREPAAAAKRSANATRRAR